MAINFVTGLPRHGKTLWTIVAVKERAEREKRAVYTCNIPGITVPGWLEIDHPDKWLELPDGAIIIVDELQDFWGKSSGGAKVPPAILELSKHGKRGFDFYFITQEPNLVHATPRDLCQHHYYIVRAFGTHNASVRKFERMQLHPDKQKKLGELTPWRYPKEAFGWYKSADVHNVKRSIPKKIFLIPIGLIFAACMIWFGISLFSSTMDKAKRSGMGLPVAIGKAGASPGQVSQPVGAVNSVQSTADVVASYVPRIEGLPQTAPRYDEQTKPVAVPYPAACVAMGSRCDCYTQQGTKLQTPAPLCKQIVAQGFFMDFAPGGTPVGTASTGAQPLPGTPTENHSGFTPPSVIAPVVAANADGEVLAFMAKNRRTNPVQ